MIVYANGDSHIAAAEAVLTHCFANDDENYVDLGRKAHPENLKVSLVKIVADYLNAELVCDAESGASNDYILRTTSEYLKTNTPDLIIIGWSTWEREEFFHNGVYYQFSAGWNGNDWPNKVVEEYKKWAIDRMPWYYENLWHEKIFKFHTDLTSKNIPHLFFNTYLSFYYPSRNKAEWGKNYINPYSDSYTYFYWLKNQGIKTVNPNSYHYGPDGHKKWAEFLLPYVNDILGKNVI